MYLKILIISQMVCTSVYSGLIDISNCPAGPLWKHRAAVVCRVPEQYHCLYDSFNSDRENAIYVERCFPPKRYKGKRYVVSGYLDAEDCQKENYSPYPITSNVNTGADCPLKKSLCNEAGQVTVSDGSSSEDRTCRCNFEQGYRYINEPQNPCSCHPFLEDCSCYRDKCSVVTGNVCKQPTYFSVICDKPLITDIIDAGSDISKSSNLLQDNMESVQHNDKKTFKIVTVILIIAAICIALSIAVVGQLETTTNDTDTNQDIINNTVVDGQFENISKDTDKNPDTLPLFIECQAPVSEDTETRIQKEFDGINQEIKFDKNIKEIYREPINTVEYYVPTSQLDLIIKALLNKRKQLVILEGMHGIGKKQTAYKFCKEYRGRYSFICKLEFDNRLSFVDIVGKIAKELQLVISQEQKVESHTVIDQLRNYFEKSDGVNFRYLLFLDKVDIENESHYEDIQKLIELRNDISNLDIIVATTDKTFKQLFGDERKEIVKFKGMRDIELVKLFKGIKDDDIKKLVKTVGRIPLVLNSVRLYLQTTKERIPNYIKMFESNKETNSVLVMFDRAYPETAIASQKTSLKYVKEQLEKKWPLVWESLRYLEYLCYWSISDTVLEALYYHKDKGCRWTKKKKGINQAIITLKRVCLCDVNESSGDNEPRVLKFHNVTIRALQEITMEIEKKSDDLKCLLKTFCYEIDIDARTDLSVARNLLFIEHAEKLLAIIEEEDICANDRQLQFCQSYLHCAIGSTLLFQRTQIYNAHKHLMRARRIGLLLVQDKSIFDKNICTYQRKETKGTEKPDLLKIQEVASNLYNESRKLFADGFVRSFMIEKRRNQNDVDVIGAGGQKLDVFKWYYLSEEDYKKLVECNLALDVNCVSKLLLPELILRILHNNALALNELTYIASNEDKEGYKRLQKACYAESVTLRTYCEEVSSLMRNNDTGEIKMFVCLENERSGVILNSWYQMEREQNGIDFRQELETDITNYERMIENYEGQNKQFDGCYYEFGVVKISNDKYNWHTASCRQILIQCLMNVYDEEKMAGEIEIEKTKPKIKTTVEKDTNDERIEGKKNIYDKCLQITKELEKQVEEIEKDNSQMCWLSLPLLNIQCGKCLRMTGNPKRALAYFEKAIKFETDRGALFTRFVIEGYEEQIKCLLTLGKINEAIAVTDLVMETNKDKNRDNIVEKFQKMKDEINQTPSKANSNNEYPDVKL